MIMHRLKAFSEYLKMNELIFCNYKTRAQAKADIKIILDYL